MDSDDGRESPPPFRPSTHLRMPLRKGRGQLPPFWGRPGARLLDGRDRWGRLRDRSRGVGRFARLVLNSVRFWRQHREGEREDRPLIGGTALDREAASVALSQLPADEEAKPGA